MIEVRMYYCHGVVCLFIVNSWGTHRVDVTLTEWNKFKKEMGLVKTNEFFEVYNPYLPQMSMSIYKKKGQ